MVTSVLIVEDNCCFCNTAAFTLATEDKNVDLFFVSFRNGLYEVPFVVLADHETRSIVITIRGSCSLVDLVTDLCLDDEVLSIDVDADPLLRTDATLDAEGEVRVHRGMLMSARYVFDTLRRHSVLEDLAVLNTNYQLVVCGHSLGAGVASLLTLLLKQEYPDVRCFAFAPPGCVISGNGLHEMEQHVMSIVSGDDVVSRISYHAMQRLRIKVAAELDACTKAKYEILIRGVFRIFFNPSWEAGPLSGNNGTVTDRANLITDGTNPNGSYGAAGSEAPTTATMITMVTNERLASRVELFAPGKLLYIAEDENLEGGVSSQWIDPKCLTDVKLTASALTDHLPKSVERMLKKIADVSCLQIAIIALQIQLKHAECFDGKTVKLLKHMHTMSIKWLQTLLKTMSDLELSQACAGDLVFLAKETSACSFERAVSDVASSPYYHVAIIGRDKRLLHASTRGVLSQSMEEFLNEYEPHRMEIVHVKAPEKAKRDAAAFAESKVGMPYNDIFTPNRINSQGQESYYCSQLITEAYDGAVHFPEHKLNFKDKDGDYLEYWLKYYRERGIDIPQDDQGSHPASLRRSPLLDMKLTRHLQKKILNCKNVTNALHYIGGAAVRLTAGKKFQVIEPRSGSTLTECHAATPDEVDRAVATAQEAQKTWSKMGWLERGLVLRNVAKLLREHCEVIARWESIDSGKPITEARMDVLSCVDTFNYYGGAIYSQAGQHIPLGIERFAYTKREPLGVVGCIGTWNYPIQTCSWKVAPALACGNAVVYKPSPLAPISAVILAQILQLAGLPEGTFNVIQGDAETGQALVLHPLVKKVSFTGAVPTGKKIMQDCAARNVKPITLELGGKASLIIFEDADVESAVAGAMMANFYSQGQVCTNASKVLVHRSLEDNFVASLREKTKAMKIGDPLEETTRVGAHISREHMEKVKKYIDDAKAAGARVICGGEPIQVNGLEAGFYLSPCILSNIKKDMDVYREEIFGSVLLIIPFDTEEEAIGIANDTTLGLAAGLFTKDLARAHRVADRLHAGNVYVNTYNDVSPFVPFGGYGDSGFGRENGIAALEHYSQIKSVFVSIASKLENPFKTMITWLAYAGSIS
uniref:Lipase and Aldehyde dehydrogenase domain containing protein n=1 Tax=Haemonchus contortus TaxID=6289 RepID=W6NCD6_HAECO